MKHNYGFHKVLTAVLTIAALAAAASAWAENTWTVSNPSGSKFTITRSGNTSKGQRQYINNGKKIFIK